MIGRDEPVTHEAIINYYRSHSPLLRETCRWLCGYWTAVELISLYPPAHVRVRPPDISRLMGIPVDLVPGEGLVLL